MAVCHILDFARQNPETYRIQRLVVTPHPHSNRERYWDLAFLESEMASRRLGRLLISN
jgi:hypothetical protein